MRNKAPIKEDDFVLKSPTHTGIKTSFNLSTLFVFDLPVRPSKEDIDIGI